MTHEPASSRRPSGCWADSARLQAYGRIHRCDVMIEQPHHHHRRGNPFHVRIELSVPGARARGRTMTRPTRPTVAPRHATTRTPTWRSTTRSVPRGGSSPIMRASARIPARRADTPSTVTAAQDGVEVPVVVVARRPWARSASRSTRLTGARAVARRRQYRVAASSSSFHRCRDSPTATLRAVGRRAHPRQPGPLRSTSILGTRDAASTRCITAPSIASSTAFARFRPAPGQGRAPSRPGLASVDRVATQVGARRGRPVVLVVHAARMVAAGHVLPLGQRRVARRPRPGRVLEAGALVLRLVERRAVPGVHVEQLGDVAQHPRPLLRQLSASMRPIVSSSAIREVRRELGADRRRLGGEGAWCAASRGIACERRAPARHLEREEA